MSVETALKIIEGVLFALVFENGREVIPSFMVEAIQSGAVAEGGKIDLFHLCEAIEEMNKVTKNNLI